MRTKKGSGRDLFFLIAFMFFLGIAFYVSLTTYNSVIDALKTTDIGNNQQAVDAMDSVATTLGKLDYFFMIVFIFLIIAMMISSFLVDIHPIFYVIFAFAWILSVLVAVLISYVFDRLLEFSYFGSYLAQFPFAYYVFDYLPVITTVIGFLLVVVMFVKTRQGAYMGV